MNFLYKKKNYQLNSCHYNSWDRKKIQRQSTNIEIVSWTTEKTISISIFKKRWLGQSE